LFWTFHFISYSFPFVGVVGESDFNIDSISSNNLFVSVGGGSGGGGGFFHTVL